MEPEGSLTYSQNPAPIPFVSKIYPDYASPSHCLKVYFNVVLPSKPRHSKCVLSLRSSQQNPVCTSHLPLMCYMLRSAHFILIDLITQIIFGEEYRTLGSSLCSILLSPITSPFLGPNVFLSTLFSNTLSLCSSINMTDLVTCSVCSKKWRRSRNPKLLSMGTLRDIQMKHDVAEANIHCHNSCHCNIFYQLLKTLYCGVEFIVTILQLQVHN